MIRLLTLTSLLLLSGLNWAAEAPADGAKKVHATFERLFPELKDIRVVATPMPGMYEVSVPGGETVFASENGEHFLVGGALYQARGNSFINLSELKDSRERRKAMSQIEPQDFITFAAKKEKAVVNIFTDIDCGYCRKIHREVAELNNLGVTVRYLAYPRTGVGSASYDKAVTAWCAKDKQDTLTKLKQRKSVKGQTCEGNPVAEQHALGGQLGVRGTPAIVLESGQLVPGYMPAKELAKVAGVQ